MMDGVERGMCSAMNPCANEVRHLYNTGLGPSNFFAPEHHSIIMSPLQERTPHRPTVPALAALDDDVRRVRKRADG